MKELISNKLKSQLLASIKYGESEWSGLAENGLDEVREKILDANVSLNEVIGDLRPYIKQKMKEAFEAGRDYTDVSRYPEDGFYFEHEDFKTWFKKKYK